MFKNYLTRNLKEGEVPLKEVRRYPWSLAGAWAVVALFVLAPFFFLFPLLRFGVWGVAVFFISLGLGLLLLLRVVLLYYLNVLFITNLRLIDVDQHGFLNQVVSETTYDKIQDVSYSIKGIRQTLFHYGNVQIQTAGNSANLEVRHVRNPERIHELIMRVQGEHRTAQSTEPNQLSAEELVGLVQRLKAGLGDEEFAKLVARGAANDGKRKGPTPRKG